jgi:hypothetical protein
MQTMSSRIVPPSYGYGYRAFPLVELLDTISGGVANQMRCAPLTSLRV